MAGESTRVKGRAGEGYILDIREARGEAGRCCWGMTRDASRTYIWPPQPCVDWCTQAHTSQHGGAASARDAEGRGIERLIDPMRARTRPRRHRRSALNLMAQSRLSGYCLIWKTSRVGRAKPLPDESGSALCPGMNEFDGISESQVGSERMTRCVLVWPCPGPGASGPVAPTSAPCSASERATRTRRSPFLTNATESTHRLPWLSRPHHARRASMLPICAAKCHGAEPSLFWVVTSTPCWMRTRAMSTFLFYQLNVNVTASSRRYPELSRPSIEPDEQASEIHAVSRPHRNHLAQRWGQESRKRRSRTLLCRA
jgi:hypothetical protein